MVVVLLVLSSCKPQNCDNMYPCKLVYLKEPYKTTCLYCKGKQYKVIAHLIIEHHNNEVIGVVGKLPDNYTTNYDTMNVMVSYSYVPKGPDLWTDPLPNPEHLPIKFVRINCID